MPTYVAYDARNGQIISVHHGAADASHIRERAHHHTRIDLQHIAVIPVQRETVEKGKRYKVDAGSKTLIEAAQGEGFHFGFGRAENARSR